MNQLTCPCCKAGTLSRGEGRLDQSGDSYLPTVVWSCGRCGYSRYDAATGKRWRPAAPAAEAPAQPRAARPLRAA